MGEILHNFKTKVGYQKRKESFDKYVLCTIKKKSRGVLGILGYSMKRSSHRMYFFCIFVLMCAVSTIKLCLMHILRTTLPFKNVKWSLAVL